jgi:LmbE family N-acetylglucosaminyl deacetylase
MATLAKYTEPNLPPFSPRQVIFYQFRTEFTPSFVVDISAHIDRKAEAINCYGSQLIPPPENSTPTLLSSSNSLSALRARDGHLGAYIGVQFGEGFLSRATLRIDDVVQHARMNPTSNALFFQKESL